MNRSLSDLAASGLPAEVLVVSQFTLYGDASNGRRPSWIAAARPEHAEPIVAAVVEELRALGADRGDGPVPHRHAGQPRQRRAGHADAGTVTSAGTGVTVRRRRRRSVATSLSRSTIAARAAKGLSPRRRYQVWPPRSGTSRTMHRRLADRRPVVHGTVVGHERAEPGRRGLHHPPPLLDRPQLGRRDLLRLEDGPGVAGPVRRVEHHLGRRQPTRFAGAAAEEHLPRDHDAERGASGMSSTAAPSPATASSGDLVDGQARAPRGARASGCTRRTGTRRTLS